MVDLHDVDENAPWRNDPLAVRAVMAAREWNIYARKGKEAIKPQQNAVMDYGKVLLEVRSQHTSNKKYNEEVIARRLNITPFDDYRYRSAALAIAKVVNYGVVNSSEIANPINYGVVNSYANAFDACDTGNAQHMATWARKIGLIPPKKRNPEMTAQARARVRVAVENGDTIGRTQIAEDLGTHNSTVDVAIGLERGRLEGIVEGEAVALNEQGKFTKAQAKHVEALIKKYRRELNSQFAAAVQAEVNKQVVDRKASLERAQEACAKQKNDAYKDQQYWKKLINNHKPLFTMDEFRAIIIGLHPDNSASEETRARAMQSVTDKKLQLTGKS